MSPFVSTLFKATGVVALLLLIFALFNFFATAGRKHPGVSCISNEKQLGLAVSQYAQDNDEMMPNISDKSGSRTWRSAIFSYLKSPGAYQCPNRNSDDHDESPIGSDGFAQSYAANYTGDYGRTQPDRGRGAFAGPGSQAIGLQGVPRPESLIALMEAAYNPFPQYNIDDARNFSPASRRFWAGHGGGSNFLFLDMHVKWLRPMDTDQEPKGQPIKDLWYRDSTQPLSPNGVAVLQDTQSRFGPEHPSRSGRDGEGRRRVQSRYGRYTGESRAGRRGTGAGRAAAGERTG